MNRERELLDLADEAMKVADAIAAAGINGFGNQVRAIEERLRAIASQPTEMHPLLKKWLERHKELGVIGAEGETQLIKFYGESE